MLKYEYSSVYFCQASYANGFISSFSCGQILTKFSLESKNWHNFWQWCGMLHWEMHCLWWTGGTHYSYNPSSLKMLWTSVRWKRTYMTARRRFSVSARVFSISDNLSVSTVHCSWALAAVCRSAASKLASSAECSRSDVRLDCSAARDAFNCSACCSTVPTTQNIRNKTLLYQKHVILICLITVDITLQPCVVAWVTRTSGTEILLQQNEYGSSLGELC